jgi:phosphoribosylaminoimidazole-succinocarboxamide synthase
MHGEALPDGLRESERLPEPVFTPATKAAPGEHDENIDFATAADLVGNDVAEQAREIALAAYRKGARVGRERGIIIADTKFELGWIEGELVICDEVLTPDSSRFWPASTGTPAPLRPASTSSPCATGSSGGLGQDPAAPPLPPEVVEATAARYREAYERITGRSLSDWPGAS